MDESSRKWQEAAQQVMNSGAWLVESELKKKLSLYTADPDLLLYEWLVCRNIFSVRYEGDFYFPLFAFRNDDFSQPILKPILDVFNENRTPWQIAFWFSSLNGYLGARTPREVVTLDVDIVEAAAKDHLIGIRHG